MVDQSDNAGGQRLGQGSEPLVQASGPSDPAVRHADSGARPVPTERGPGEPALASGLSNYSRDSQYGNQSRYGTPAQYNDEPVAGGEQQNGDHPQDRPTPGRSGPAHPNG